MQYRILVLCLSASLTAGAANPATQFNLVCQGRETYGMHEGGAYRRDYRLDLDRKVWCEGDCKGTYPIIESTPHAITLEESNSVLSVIGREEGTHLVTITNGWKFGDPRSRIVSAKKGVCEKAAFSGFPPPPPTKF